MKKQFAALLTLIVRLPAFVIYGEGILWQKSTGVKSWS